MASLSILMSDFKASLAGVQPSAKREGFATVPDVTWEDVGALQDIREELTMAILVNITFNTHGLSSACNKCNTHGPFFKITFHLLYPLFSVIWIKDPAPSWNH